MKDLHFLEKGTGEKTLVFLHFFGGSSRSWLPVIEKLQHHYRCIAIDLPGFGDSSAPEKELSVLEIAQTVIELIEKIGLNNYVLIGHSMGGKISLCIASHKQAALRSIILVAPSPPTPEPIEDKSLMINSFGKENDILNLIEKITWKNLDKKIVDDLVFDHLRIAKMAWDGWITKASQEDITSFLPLINIPLKLISGEHDPNFSTNFLKEIFKEYFPNALYEEQKETGHLIPIEVPNALSKSIIEFVE